MSMFMPRLSAYPVVSAAQASRDAAGSLGGLLGSADGRDGQAGRDARGRLGCRDGVGGSRLGSLGSDAGGGRAHVDGSRRGRLGGDAGGRAGTGASGLGSDDAGLAGLDREARRNRSGGGRSAGRGGRSRVAVDFKIRFWISNKSKLSINVDTETHMAE